MDIQISERLKLIASFLSEGTFFADIGSDHAYLACYVCLTDKKARAIASDVNEGPFLRAKETVERYRLNQRVDVRLGDGLSVLGDDTVGELVLAGMGGTLITAILEKDKNKLQHVQRIIAQPNIGERLVRHWLIHNNYTIIDEKIIKENEKIYEIIVADRKHPLNQDPFYTDKELFFGPFLIKERSHLFKEKWQKRKTRINTILKQMKKGNQIERSKIKLLETEKLWIEEVLQNGKHKT